MTKRQLGGEPSRRRKISPAFTRDANWSTTTRAAPMIGEIIGAAIYADPPQA